MIEKAPLAGVHKFLILSEWIHTFKIRVQVHEVLVWPNRSPADLLGRFSIGFTSLYYPPAPLRPAKNKTQSITPLTKAWAKRIGFIFGPSWPNFVNPKICNTLSGLRARGCKSLIMKDKVHRQKPPQMCGDVRDVFNGWASLWRSETSIPADTLWLHFDIIWPFKVIMVAP